MVRLSWSLPCIKKLVFVHACLSTSSNILGHSVRRIENNKLLLLLFFVELDKNTNTDIFKISSFINTVVSKEKPNKTYRGPFQCHNCQPYRHINAYFSHLGTSLRRVRRRALVWGVHQRPQTSGQMSTYALRFIPLHTKDAQ